MPPSGTSVLPQPVFDEPSLTPDPATFTKKHPSDTQQYAAVQKLLAKDVVGFDASRVKPGDTYALESALGPHGQEIVQRIVKARQITFHATGDSGASNVRKYRNELHVSDQVTNDCNTGSVDQRPASVMWFIISANPSTTSISFTTLTETTRHPFSPFPAITTRSSSPGHPKPKDR